MRVCVCVCANSDLWYHCSQAVISAAKDRHYWTMGYYGSPILLAPADPGPPAGEGVGVMEDPAGEGMARASGV